MVLLLAALGYYWLLVNAGPSGIPAAKIDIAAVRAAAERIPGEKPTGITFTTLATRRVSSAALAAGTGLRYVTSGVVAWRIETPGGGIVVDPGLSAVDAEAMDFENYDDAAMRRVNGWMDEAELILFTHSHLDHAGLFLDHPRFDAISARAIITPGMKGGINALWRENGSHITRTRSLAPVEAVASGVVIIQAPGHTPASQMIYVRLANGSEYILTGDTASLAANFEKPTPRSRLLADIIAPEDRRAVIGWVKALNLLKQGPNPPILLPSHDIDWLAGHAAVLGIAPAAVSPGTVPAHERNLRIIPPNHAGNTG